MRPRIRRSGVSFLSGRMGINMHYSFSKPAWRKIIFLFPAACSILGMYGCNGKEDDGTSAGITTIGNTVAGRVLTNKGTEVPNAEVRLIPAAYNPVHDTLAEG